MAPVSQNPWFIALTNLRHMFRRHCVLRTQLYFGADPLVVLGNGRKLVDTIPSRNGFLDNW